MPELAGQEGRGRGRHNVLQLGSVGGTSVLACRRSASHMNGTTWRARKRAPALWRIQEWTGILPDSPDRGQGERPSTWTAKMKLTLLGVGSSGIECQGMSATTRRHGSLWEPMWGWSGYAGAYGQSYQMLLCPARKASGRCDPSALKSRHDLAPWTAALEASFCKGRRRSRPVTPTNTSSVLPHEWLTGSRGGRTSTPSTPMPWSAPGTGSNPDERL